MYKKDPCGGNGNESEMMLRSVEAPRDAELNYCISRGFVHCCRFLHGVIRDDLQLGVCENTVSQDVFDGLTAVFENVTTFREVTQVSVVQCTGGHRGVPNLLLVPLSGGLFLQDYTPHY